MGYLLRYTLQRGVGGIRINNFNTGIKPYVYQSEGITFGTVNPYSINACEVGLGKSLQAVFIIEENLDIKNCLVICPAYLIFNWKLELEKLLKDTTKFTIVSYAGFAKVTESYDALIFDEAHYLKNVKAKRTIFAHNYITKHEPKDVLLLSGTPIKNRVPEIFSLLLICYYGGKFPEFEKWHNNYWGFCNHFCNVERIRFGRRVITKHEGIDRRYAAELGALIKKVRFRRRACDVLDLPKKIRKKVFTSKKTHNKELEQVWLDYHNGVKPKHGSTVKADNALAKVKGTVEHVKNVLEEVEQVIIFSDHVLAVEGLRKGLSKVTGSYITGATSKFEREKIITSFMQGKLRVLIMTIGAGSTGLNLMNCHYMIINDFPWVPADITQLEGRISRIGQTHTCNYDYMVSSTVDAKILDKVIQKIQDIKLIG